MLEPIEPVSLLVSVRSVRTTCSSSHGRKTAMTSPTTPVAETAAGFEVAVGDGAPPPESEVAVGDVPDEPGVDVGLVAPADSLVAVGVVVSSPPPQAIAVAANAASAKMASHRNLPIASTEEFTSAPFPVDHCGRHDRSQFSGPNISVTPLARSSEDCHHQSYYLTGNDLFMESSSLQIALASIRPGRICQNSVVCPDFRHKSGQKRRPFVLKESLCPGKIRVALGLAN